MNSKTVADWDAGQDVLGKSRRHTRRFTLAELIVAGAVVTAAAVGIFGTMIQAHHLVENARERQEAQTLALDTLWRIFNQRYADLLHLQDNPQVSAVPSDSVLYDLGGTIRTAVLRYPDHCRVMVRVDWVSRTFTRQARPMHVALSMDRYNTER